MENQIFPVGTVTEITDADEVTVVKTNAKTTTDIPNSFVDVHALSLRVLSKWSTCEAQYPVLWMSVERFTALVAEFGDAIEISGSAGSTRSVIKNEMKLLNEEINETLKNIPNYLFEKYRTNGFRAHLPTYGYKKVNGSYKFPVKKDERMAALKMLCDAMEKNKLGEGKIYDLSYWREKEQKYSSYYTQGYEKTGTVASSSGDKGQMRDEIRKVFSSLKKIIQGNHPKTWKKEFRVWGFLREVK